VGGRCVGYAGTPSEFYRIYVRLKPKAEADAALVTRLLAHERPVFRSMGLALLVRRDGEKAIPELRKRLADRGPVGYQPDGCVWSSGSVGVVARDLLHNRNLIESHHETAPLLDPEGRRALDLDILVRDDTYPVHEVVQSALRQRIGYEFRLEMKVLRRHLPERSELDLVKAAGRLVLDRAAPSEYRVQSFLETVAGDEKRPESVRLAALSGISRNPGPEGRRILEEHRPFLKAAGKLGILEEWSRLVEFAEAFRPEVAWRETAAVRRGDPVVLPILLREALEAHREGRPIPKWVVSALDRMTARAEAGFPAWYTRSDVSLRLVDFATFGEDALVKSLGEKAGAAFVARLRRLAKK